MLVKKMAKLLLASLLCLSTAAPALAEEIFGRAVAYDKTTHTLTFIQDRLNWSNPKRPEFDVLPAREVIIPDPGRDAPKAGGRLRIDYKSKEIIIYNPTSKNIETFGVEIVSITENVERKDPLVYENDKPRKFPVVDKAKSEVTIYSARQKSVATIKVPEEYMELPDSVWDDGHNIKVVMEGGKAVDFINLSRAM